MALVAYRTFSGQLPRMEPHLLPSGAAQQASNCIFTAGVIQSARDGVYLKDMQSNPVRGLYTEDGLNFYSWPTETRAFRSPVKTDVHNRMYFLTLQEGVFKVASRLSMSPLGPKPLDANTSKVGVPTPLLPPGLELVDRSTLADHADARFRAEAWWEDAGQQFGYAAVTLTQITLFKSYRLAAPAKPQGTPATAVLRCKLFWESGTKKLAQITLDTTSSVTSNAFPGAQEYSLRMVNSAWQVDIEWGIYGTAAYQFTIVNDWDEEGAPSPAALVRPTYLQDVRITVPNVSMTGYKGRKEYRLYRTYGSTSVFVGVEASAQGGNIYLDESRSASVVGLAITTTDYDPPPEGLQGLELAPNGVFAMFKDNQLYLTEPYRPHACSYIYTFSHSIRGVVAGQQGLLITTADGLYLLAGTNPAAMQPVRLALPQAGIAQRSMVDVDGGVIYASSDGLVAVNGAQPSTTLSQQLFGREVWRKQYGDLLRDASLRLSYHDGHLLASSHTQPKGFVLRLDETVASLATHSQRMDCTFQLPVEDALYYSVGQQLFQFGAGADLEFYWHGRDEIFPHGEIFGAGFLRSTAAVTLTIWCDDVKVYESLVKPGHFRLPSKMPRCLRMSVAVRGKGKVQELCLARSLSELRNG